MGGFWHTICAYALTLLQGPVFHLQPESLTAPSPYFDPPPGRELYAAQIYDPALPNTQKGHNAYRSEFETANRCNGPNDRGSWCGGRSVRTDYEVVGLTPETGWTNYITLEVTSGNRFCGDGFCRDTTLINGTYPGPLIRGNWGDWFEITVINKLKNCNGTSIHWHGIRQWNTVWEDGVAGVTQCPIAPGHRQTYRWRATQYGSSWYHSHFSLQYANGIAGPLIIDGPSSANYDIDKGPLMLSDWYHADAFSLYHQEVQAVPPQSFQDGAPATLVNGQGRFIRIVDNGTRAVFGCEEGTEGCEPEKASIYRTDVQPSKGEEEVTVYKYRVINMSVNTHYSFWIDGHDFWVVATDFVPIKPIKRRFLNVAIGQRYDILIEAKTAANLSKKWDNHPNFWIKMRLCNRYCFGDPCPPGKKCSYVECRQGILSYDKSSQASPDLNSRIPKAPSTSCADPERADLKPIVTRDLTGQVPENMAFKYPFEVDRRGGTQNATQVFGKGVHVKEGAMSEEPDTNGGPLPPPNFGDPEEKNEAHIWDFGSSHTSAAHPNGSYVSFMIDWANATLGLAGDGIPPHTWNPRFVPVVLDKPDAWTIFAIVGNWSASLNHGVSAGKAIPGAAHPIHLHGHDFVVLASSTHPFVYGQSYGLDLVNPARRDVVMLPANGFVVIGFRADNPGTWLMHCHIAWHASSGLALQWVERPKEIPGLMMARGGRVKREFGQRCEAWRTHEEKKCEWKKGFVAEQDDSGI